MSKYSNETYDALKYGARAFEAITKIFSNPEFRKASKGKSRSSWPGAMVRYEPDAVIELLAAHRKMEPEELAEKVTPMTFPRGIMDVMSDPEMEPLFTSASQKMEDESSGSRTESTEETEET